MSLWCLYIQESLNEPINKEVIAELSTHLGKTFPDDLVFHMVMVYRMIEARVR